MRSLDTIIVHCSATPPDMDIGRAEIDRWHRERGWDGIGYHFVIRRDGTVEVGRALARAGAHAKGHNARSIGICLVGGVRRVSGKLVSEANFTQAQFDTLDREIRRLLREHKTIANVIGHRDVEKGKECPSFSVRDFMQVRGLLPRVWS